MFTNSTRSGKINVADKECTNDFLKMTALDMKNIKHIFQIFFSAISQI